MDSEHLARRTFEKARDEKAQQEAVRAARLTEDQRRQFEALKKEQARTREQERRDIEAKDQQVKEAIRKTKAALQHNPKAQGALFSRRAQELQAQLKSQVNQLDRTTIIQESERIKFLDNAERERARQEQVKDQENTKDDALARAFNKAAQQQGRAQNRENAQGSDLSRTFNKSSGRNR